MARALRTAREQSAKIFELRSAASLGRLMIRKGKLVAFEGGFKAGGVRSRNDWFGAAERQNDPERLAPSRGVVASNRPGDKKDPRRPIAAEERSTHLIHAGFRWW